MDDTKKTESLSPSQLEDALKMSGELSKKVADDILEHIGKDDDGVVVGRIVREGLMGEVWCLKHINQLWWGLWDCCPVGKGFVSPDPFGER